MSFKKIVLPLLFFSFATLLIAPKSFALRSFFGDGIKQRVVADLESLRALSIDPVSFDEDIQVGVAHIDRRDQRAILAYNHELGKCGGFEVLPASPFFVDDSESLLKQLKLRVAQDQIPNLSPLMASPRLNKNNNIDSAISNLRADNLRATVQWLSSFPNRDNRESSPNKHVEQFKGKVDALISKYGYASSELVSHNQTRQKTLKVTLKGSQRPNEIIVLGGHLDSINTGWFGSKQAPGADDNASGSANLLEILRVLLQQSRPERSVEFFWYAGEESGLLGSAEIAQTYKNMRKDVIAVLQLDMTLFAGSGELTMANMTDFTSPWLREVLSQLNSMYVGARMLEDRCGYGCSDHASWYRQGFSTVVPFEAKTSSMNRKIHTDEDVINSSSNFHHSLAFSKLGLAFAMELANSRLR